MTKFAVLYSLIAIGFITSARGDLTIEQRVEAGGQKGDVTVKVKGDKERVDAPEQPIRIIDGKKGEMIDLMVEQKTFVRISADQMKAAAETISKFNADKPAAEKKLTPTGKKETVNGYETEEYVYETPQFKASFWVAPKYPDAQNILKQMQGPVTGAWKPSNLGMPDYTDFAGLPVKTVISVGNNQVVTTIMSVKQDSLNAAEFEVPKGFQEMKKPLGSPPPAGDATASPR